MNKQRIIRFLRKLSGFIATLPLIFSFILSYFQVTPADYGEKLRFDDKGEFCALVLAGLLEGEGGFSQKTKEYINDLLIESKPDLVILGGNNIAPQPIATDLFMASTMNIIDEYTALFDNGKTYFTALFGDYDMASLFDKTAQLKRYMRSKYFVGGIAHTDSLYTLYNRKKGLCGNFRITVFAEDKPAYYLYIMDYRGGEIPSAQQSWFEGGNADLPSVVFSFKSLYAWDDNKTEYLLYNENVKAYVSMGDWANEGQDNAEAVLIKTPLIGKYSAEGSVQREYRAKKIVLSERGGLTVIDY